MADEMHHALLISEAATQFHENSSPRLWHPHFSWAWLGAAPDTFILDKRSAVLGDDPAPDVSTNLSAEEAREGLAESAYITAGAESEAPPCPSMSNKPIKKQFVRPSSRQLLTLVNRIWRSKPSLRVRLVLSRFLRSIQHSSHLRHGLKNATGVAFLSIPAFLPQDSAGASHAQSWLFRYIRLD